MTDCATGDSGLYTCLVKTVSGQSSASAWVTVLEESKENKNGLRGTIDPACDAAEVAKEAFENAAFLCDQIYMDSPKLKLSCVNVADETEDKVNFVYIPK